MIPYLTINFHVKTNTDWNDVITFYEPWEGMEDGEPVPVDQPLLDFTGATFAMHLRKNIGDTRAAIVLTTENGRLSPSETPEDGKLIWSVPVSVMSGVEPNVFLHDILIMQDGSTKCLAIGTVTTEQGITR
jgi:hypothetical protein